MNRKWGLLLLITYVTAYTQQDTSLIISEIMFYPQSGNNEYIEIYNTGTVSIDLNGFRIKYYNAADDIITDAGWGTMLPPLGFAVIFEGDYEFISGIYSGIVPPSALKMIISDNSFGATGMANTSDRPVKLLSPTASLLDQRFYTADNTSGYSEEKIIMNHDSLDANWSNSLVFNGTPGYRNSVTLLNNDICLKELFCLPAHPLQGDNISIRTVILNKGILTAGYIQLFLYNDINLDSIPDPDELLYSYSFYNMLPADSILIETIVEEIITDHNIIAKAVFQPDEDTLNNIKYLKVSLAGTVQPGIIFNEIMYAPASGMPEWLEIYNRSDESINLKSMKLSDNTSSVYITRNDLLLPADSFLILSKDSSIFSFFEIPCSVLVISLPSLNNSGDDLVIKDSSGNVCDSISYMPDWGGSNGRSLERVSSEESTNDPDNWGSTESFSKGTPGRINSLTGKNYDLKISSFTTAEYGITGEGIEVIACIKNRGILSSGPYILKLFYDVNKDSSAQEVEIFYSSSGAPLITGDSVKISFMFSGYSEGNNYLIAVVETVPDEDPYNNLAYTRFTGVNAADQRYDLVLNEIMYAPVSPEPEWIEIYNRSSKVIDIKNYFAADNNDTIRLTNKSFLLKPGCYLVAASDSSILNHYSISSCLIIKKLPTLNNQGDRIILLDSLRRTIDSLYYMSSWGIPGRSIERINVNLNSVDSANWSPSISRNRGTPGYINSVSDKEFDIGIRNAATAPSYPQRGDDVSILVSIINNGSAASSFILKLYSDTDLDSLPDLIIENITGLNIPGKDSAVYEFNFKIKSLDEREGYFIKADASIDQDTSNNYVYLSVCPGYPPASVVLNEIMYAPPAGETEWFEFVNTTSVSINLFNWMIEDISSERKVILVSSDFYLLPDEFLVIASDSSFFNTYPEPAYKVIIRTAGTLNNSSDGVMLYDLNGAVIDSVYYRSSWGGSSGRSLERISLLKTSCDSTNWISSLSPRRSTPGEENSINAIEDYFRNDAAINEILADPDIDNSEFVEFYNLTSTELNIGGWRIEDENGNKFFLSDTIFMLPPAEYFVLAADSLVLTKYDLYSKYKNVVNKSSLGLINSGELILLKDARGNVIDSVFYSVKWHNKHLPVTKNISLERINPLLNANESSGWNSSTEAIGATPGAQNSIYSFNRNTEAVISCSPNPFSPDYDGHEDYTIINYNLKNALAQIRVKIFDSTGRLVRTLLQNYASAGTGSIVFNGLNDEGQPLRIGIYIIYMEAVNETSGKPEILKTVVVIARKLY
jgi:hypothetical protein